MHNRLDLGKMSGSLCPPARWWVYKEALIAFSHMYSSDGLSNINLSRLGVTPAVGTVGRVYWGRGKPVKLPWSSSPLSSRWPSPAPGALNFIGPLSILTRSHARFCPTVLALFIRKTLVHGVMQLFVDTFHYTISKKSYRHLSHQKSLSILESCQAHAGRYTFSKLLIFIWKLEFYHWQNRLSVVSLEMKGPLCSFLRNVCEIPKSG